MVTILITHDVDDVQHWLASPHRGPAFGSVGFTVRTFVDPTSDRRVGLVAEGSSLDQLQQLIASSEAAEVMKLDGVRPDTIVTYVQG